MPYTGPDRRRSPRKETKLDVDFSLFIKDAVTKKYSNDFEYTLDHSSTANMGGGGLCLFTKEQLKIGTKVLVLIEIPLQDDLAVAVSTVIWSKQKDNEGPFRAGLEYDLVKPQDKEKINSYLERQE